MVEILCVLVYVLFKWRRVLAAMTIAVVIWAVACVLLFFGLNKLVRGFNDQSGKVGAELNFSLKSLLVVVQRIEICRPLFN